MGTLHRNEKLTRKKLEREKRIWSNRKQKSRIYSIQTIDVFAHPHMRQNACSQKIKW